MSKKFLKIVVVVVLFFVPKIVFGNVVINEIAWMGTPVQGIESKDWWRYEWLELYNNDGNPVVIDGWRIELYRSDLDFGINLTGTIPANGYFLIVSSDKIPGYDLNYANLGGKLNNGGQKILLKDNSNTIIDNLDFSSGWPAGDNTTKQTMERNTNGWQTSLNAGGTPKAQNSTGATEESSSTSEQPTTQSSEPKPGSATNQPPIAEAGSDIIAFVGQEIKFDGSKSSDPDGDELAYSWNMGDGKLIEKPTFAYQYFYPGTYIVALMVYDDRYYVSDTATIQIQAAQITINEFLPNPSGKDEEEEWIEIYNDSDSITDISGWQLDDAEGGSAPFTFPQNTLIAPKSYLVFSRQITDIALNNDKDSVRLLLPGGIVFQEVKYENPAQGKSSARTNEGFVWSEPSPGRANIPLVVSVENKNIIYQNGTKTETTKEPSANLAVLYAPAQEINGGYTEVAQNPQTNNQLAQAKQIVFRSVSNNLLYIMIIVILVGLAVGILLVKLRKKNHEFPHD